MSTQLNVFTSLAVSPGLASSPVLELDEHALVMPAMHYCLSNSLGESDSEKHSDNLGETLGEFDEEEKSDFDLNLSDNEEDGKMEEPDKSSLEKDASLSHENSSVTVTPEEEPYLQDYSLMELDTIRPALVTFLDAITFLSVERSFSEDMDLGEEQWDVISFARSQKQEPVDTFDLLERCRPNVIKSFFAKGFNVRELLAMSKMVDLNEYPRAIVYSTYSVLELLGVPDDDKYAFLRNDEPVPTLEAIVTYMSLGIESLDRMMEFAFAHPKDVRPYLELGIDDASLVNFAISSGISAQELRIFTQLGLTREEMKKYAPSLPASVMKRYSKVYRREKTIKLPQDGLTSGGFTIRRDPKNENWVVAGIDSNGLLADTVVQVGWVITKICDAPISKLNEEKMIALLQRGGKCTYMEKLSLEQMRILYMGKVEPSLLTTFYARGVYDERGIVWLMSEPNLHIQELIDYSCAFNAMLKERSGGRFVYSIETFRCLHKLQQSNMPMEHAVRLSVIGVHDPDNMIKFWENKTGIELIGQFLKINLEHADDVLFCLQNNLTPTQVEPFIFHVGEVSRLHRTVKYCVKRNLDLEAATGLHLANLTDLEIIESCINIDVTPADIVEWEQHINDTVVSANAVIPDEAAALIFAARKFGLTLEQICQYRELGLGAADEIEYFATYHVTPDDIRNFHPFKMCDDITSLQRALSREAEEDSWRATAIRTEMYFRSLHACHKKWLIESQMGISLAYQYHVERFCCEDAIKLHEHGIKPFVAGIFKKAGLSLDETIESPLATELDLEIIEGCVQAGMKDILDVVKVWPIVRLLDNPIMHLQSFYFNGIEDADTIRVFLSHNIPPAQLFEWKRRNVSKKAMIKYITAGHTVDEVAPFIACGISDEKQIEYYLRHGISIKVIQRFFSAGIDDVNDIFMYISVEGLRF